MNQFTISATTKDSLVYFEGYIDWRCYVEGKTIVPEGNLGVMISTSSDMSNAKEYQCHAIFYSYSYYHGYFDDIEFYRTVYDLPYGTYYYCAYADAPYSTRLTTNVQSFVLVKQQGPTFCDTAEFTNVTATSFNISYKFEDIGTYPITEHGLCYNTQGKSYAPMQTSHMYSSPSTGEIYCYPNPSGITAGTTYYFWAYAVTSEGTFYSNEWVITTPKQ